MLPAQGHNITACRCTAAPLPSARLFEVVNVVDSAAGRLVHICCHVARHSDVKEPARWGAVSDTAAHSCLGVAELPGWRQAVQELNAPHAIAAPGCRLATPAAWRVRGGLSRARRTAPVGGESSRAAAHGLSTVCGGSEAAKAGPTQGLAGCMRGPTHLRTPPTCSPLRAMLARSAQRTSTSADADAVKTTSASSRLSMSSGMRPMLQETSGNSAASSCALDRLRLSRRTPLRAQGPCVSGLDQRWGVWLAMLPKALGGAAHLAHCTGCDSAAQLHGNNGCRWVCCSVGLPWEALTCCYGNRQKAGQRTCSP